MGIKIAVVGGGSTYTPELVDGIARRSTRLTADELALFDIDAERLEIVGGLAERMLRRGGWTGRLTVTTDRSEALDGADFVLIQLRVGGQQARLVDETLPNEFGAIGQETTGAGGFAKALRTVPVLLEIAAEVSRRAAKDAWIVDFTNPVGIATRALLDEGHRAIGLCNVAIGLQRRFAQRFGVSPEDVELEHVGTNHLSWERAIRVNGVDRLPELLDSDAEGLAEMVGAPIEAVRALRAVPSYYLRYYYSTPEVLAEQREGHHRAQEVMRIEHELLEMYRDPSLDTKPELLEHRGGAFYSEAAAQLIASLHDGLGDVQVVDTYNRGALPDLPDDVVVEVPARITRSGAEPLELAPLAPDMHGLVEAARGYEELTIAAAKSGDRRLALRALAANPLVPDWATAEKLLDALLAANSQYLPRFFPEDAVA
jgi:6-phospho-beta-glucosidase